MRHLQQLEQKETWFGLGAILSRSGLLGGVFVKKRDWLLVTEYFLFAIGLTHK